MAPLYKVILGPFLTENEANKYRSNLLQKHKMKGFTVDLSQIIYEN